MLLEGLIDENIEYDDWISHSNTWLALGKRFSKIFLLIICLIPFID